MCHFVAHYPYSLFLIFLVGIIPSPSRLHPCSHLYQQLFSLPLALTPAGGHPTLEASHLPKVGWCSISPWKSGHYPSWTVELGNHCSFFTIPPTPIWWGRGWPCQASLCLSFQAGQCGLEVSWLRGFNSPSTSFQLALSFVTGFINKFLILIMNLHSGRRWLNEEKSEITSDLGEVNKCLYLRLFCK